MLRVEMTASVRESSGKGAMRRLREEGMTPAVVYGAGKPAEKIQLDTKILTAQLLQYARRNTIVDLQIEGEGHKNVIIGEVQTDPVRDTLIHVDFCELDLNAERSFNVPVVYKGVAKGVDLGGTLVVSLDAIVLQGKPLDIPDQCVVDVSALEIGDAIRCRKIAIPDNVVLVTDPKATAVSVVKAGIRIEDEEEEAEEGVEETVEEAAESAE